MNLLRWFLTRIFFLILLKYFRYFVIITPWKWHGPSSEQTWFPFNQGYFRRYMVEIFWNGVKHYQINQSIQGYFVPGWNLPSGSDKVEFYNSSFFSLFCQYLLMKKGVIIHLNNWIPFTVSPKNVLNQFLLKLNENQKIWLTNVKTDGRTDRRRSTGDQRNSLKLKLKGF